MAAFNFPNSPSTNDLHTENGVTYKWNGTVWKRQNASYTDATNLNVTGISTFAGNITANGNIVGDNSTDISGIKDVTISMLSISDTITHTGDTNTKIRFPSADTISAETAGSERLRIDSNGRILQGKTSTKGSTGENVPTFCNEVASVNPNVFEIANNGTNANSYPALVLSRSDGSSVNDHTAVDSGDQIGELCFIGADGADRFNTAAAIKTFANADFTANDCPAYLSFFTNEGSASATERFRINSIGKVGISTGTIDPDGNQLLIRAA